MDKHQAGTAVGLDQPVHRGRISGHLCDQRSEKLLVGGQLNQQPSHLVHIRGPAGTQFSQLSQEPTQRVGKGAGTHLWPPSLLAGLAAADITCP